MVFNTKNEYSEVHQGDEGSDGEGSPRMPPPSNRLTHSGYRMLMVFTFLCCIVSVAVGFFLGTYGFSLAARQTACVPEPKKVDPITGLGMATIDEAPFITDGRLEPYDLGLAYDLQPICSASGPQKVRTRLFIQLHSSWCQPEMA